MKKLIFILTLAALIFPENLCAKTEISCKNPLPDNSDITAQEYEYCIVRKGSPEYAKKFLDDAKAQEEMKNKTVRQLSIAITELYGILNPEESWNMDKNNALNKALSIRTGEDKILSIAGIGPEIDKIVPWAKKYVRIYQDKKNGPENIKILKTAIRDWTVIFGKKDSFSYQWKTFENEYGAPKDFTMKKKDWERYTLRDRNLYIYQLAVTEKEQIFFDLKKGILPAENYKPKYIKYVDELNEAVETAVRLKKLIKKNEESNVLTNEQKEKLKKAATDNEKIKLLNEFFDGSNIGYNSEIRLGINANQPLYEQKGYSPDFDFDLNRETLSSMINTSLVNEIKGTSAGDKALQNGLKVKIENCKNSFSELKEDGTIAIDVQVIEQFMRLRGYTANSVMKNKGQLDEIARYISPEIVYQTARRDQEESAKETYKPYTQEDIIDARSREAVYMAERMSKDADFLNMFTDLEKHSRYAEKKAENLNSYMQGRKMFADSVRMDNQNVPSASSASANLINVLNQEIECIEKLSDEERRTERPDESTLFSFDKVSRYSPEEILSYISFIQYDALIQLRNDLLNSNYLKHNKESIAQYRTLYNSFNIDDKTAE